MSTNELPVEALAHLFLDFKEPLSETWQKSARYTVSAESLHALALDANIPSIVKARNTYGHFRMASQMNKVSGRYWKPEDQVLELFLTKSQVSVTSGICDVLEIMFGLLKSPKELGNNCLLNSTTFTSSIL
jgi:hypothetical protein